MFAWLKRLMGVEDAATALLRRAKRAQEMLDAAGVKVPDTRDELRKSTAVIEALGVLELPRNEVGLLDPEVSHPAISALRRYRESMASALSAAADGKMDLTSRDAEISKARRMLVSSIPVTIPPATILEVDRVLGLPPIFPELGLNSP